MGCIENNNHAAAISGGLKWIKTSQAKSRKRWLGRPPG
jgi:hypothetical protein